MHNVIIWVSHHYPFVGIPLEDVAYCFWVFFIYWIISFILQGLQFFSKQISPKSIIIMMLVCPLIPSFLFLLLSVFRVIEFSAIITILAFILNSVMGLVAFFEGDADDLYNHPFIGILNVAIASGFKEQQKAIDKRNEYKVLYDNLVSLKIN